VGFWFSVFRCRAGLNPPSKLPKLKISVNVPLVISNRHYLACIQAWSHAARCEKLFGIFHVQESRDPEALRPCWQRKKQNLRWGGVNLCAPVFSYQALFCTRVSIGMIVASEGLFYLPDYRKFLPRARPIDHTLHHTVSPHTRFTTKKGHFFPRPKLRLKVSKSHDSLTFRRREYDKPVRGAR
jgi:hypothetical protein